MFLVEYPAEAEVKEILAELERASMFAEAMPARRPRGPEPDAWYVKVTVLTAVPAGPGGAAVRGLIRTVIGAIARRVTEGRPGPAGPAEVALVFEMPGPRIAFLFSPADLDDERAWNAMFTLMDDRASVTYAWDPAHAWWFDL
jgi:hypothetical protein